VLSAKYFLGKSILEATARGFHKLGEASLKGEVIEGRTNMEDWE
jgi:hypothetical protein